MNCAGKMKGFAVCMICILFLLSHERQVYGDSLDLFAGIGPKPDLTAYDSTLTSRDYMTKYATLTEKKESKKNSSSMDSHKVLGYAALALVAGTAVSSSEEDVHEPLGYAAAGMATAACVSGVMEYGDYFDAEEGFSEYNVHIVGGLIGTAGFILTAVLGSQDEEHGAIGGLSAGAMIVPVVVLKW